MADGSGKDGGHLGQDHTHHTYVHTAGEPYYRYRRRSSLGWGIFWLSIFVVTVTLAFVFTIRYGAPYNSSSLDVYVAKETRLITYSSTFCQSLFIDYYLHETVYPHNAQFELVSEFPKLSGHDLVQFHEKPSFYDDFRSYFWSFYLYDQSKIEFSVCKNDSQSNFKWYILKGNENYISWKDSHSNYLAIKSGTVQFSCSSPDQNNITYDITSEGDYYIAFFLPSSEDLLEIDFKISRTFYVAQPSKVIDNCTVLYNKSCTIGVPLGYSVGLLTTQTSEERWMSDTYLITVACNPRVWVYAAICISCLIFVFVTFGALVCCICIGMRKQSRRNYHSIQGESPQAPLISEAPGYGSAQEVPPPYFGSADPPKY